MSACWSSDSEKRPTFSRLTQFLGKMLEAENQSQYIVFDAISLLSSFSIDSQSGTRADCKNGDSEDNSFTQIDDAKEVRYVDDSSAPLFKETKL